jgi:hypothetical protein
MAAAGDPSFEALKDSLSRLAESNQICKFVIVSCLMVLFYDWGEQSVCSSKTHYRPSGSLVISIDWEVCGFHISYLLTLMNLS